MSPMGGGDPCPLRSFKFLLGKIKNVRNILKRINMRRHFKNYFFCKAKTRYYLKFFLHNQIFFHCKIIRFSLSRFKIIYLYMKFCVYINNISFLNREISKNSMYFLPHKKNLYFLWVLPPPPWRRCPLRMQDFFGRLPLDIDKLLVNGS